MERIRGGMMGERKGMREMVSMFTVFNRFRFDGFGFDRLEEMEGMRRMILWMNL